MSATPEPFELSMLGGAVERRYRRLRPEVDALPWSTLEPSRHSAATLERARQLWTEAAFQEHRTGAACAASVTALIAARAPLDLIAMATRFPLDELAHVELCARLVMALGGGIRLLHVPGELIIEPPADARPLYRAAELVVRNFCVGEALSIPILRASWHAARHPLIKALLGRIVKDEAAHGQFGWFFLDWAGDELTEPERARLTAAANESIAAIAARWTSLERHLAADDAADSLGWMERERYLELARRSMATHVLAPLNERGLAARLPS
jgi:hypothetical protein